MNYKIDIFNRFTRLLIHVAGTLSQYTIDYVFRKFRENKIRELEKITKITKFVRRENLEAYGIVTEVETGLCNVSIYYVDLARTLPLITSQCYIR